MVDVDSNTNIVRDTYTFEIVLAIQVNSCDLQLLPLRR
jgi:hypothetical protein